MLVRLGNVVALCVAMVEKVNERIPIINRFYKAFACENFEAIGKLEVSSLTDASRMLALQLTLLSHALIPMSLVVRLVVPCLRSILANGLSLEAHKGPFDAKALSSQFMHDNLWQLYGLLAPAVVFFVLPLYICLAQACLAVYIMLVGKLATALPALIAWFGALAIVPPIAGLWFLARVFIPICLVLVAVGLAPVPSAIIIDQVMPIDRTWIANTYKKVDRTVFQPFYMGSCARRDTNWDENDYEMFQDLMGSYDNESYG